MFLSYCKVKNLSPATLEHYSYRLTSIIGKLESHRPGMTPATTTLDDLRGMISEHIDKQAPKTTNHNITVLRTFFSYLQEEGYIDKNPTGRLDKVKSPKVLIQPFSDEQIQALLQQPNRKRFSGVRDHAMMVVLFDTGLRISELLGLKLDDVNLQQNTLKVMGKGRKERIVPFGRNARLALLQYLDRRGTALPNETLFVTEFGQTMLRRLVGLSIASYGRMAKIKGVRVSPHTFRHTFAVSALRNGMDVFHLQRMLGHSTLEICKLYLNLVTADLQKAQMLYSPMDRMSSTERQITGRTRLR